MRRSLTFFWRQHLAVGAGVAVAAAVLTGALLVGDSVRGSLLELTRERLGNVEHALVGEGFFGPGVGERLEAISPVETAALIQLPAGARHAKTRQRATGVNLLGVDGEFLTLFPPSSHPVGWELDEGSRGQPPVILNEALAGELGAAVGDAVVFSFPSAARAPRASLMGRRDAGDVLATLRAVVAAIVPDRGAAIYSLAPHQGVPFNAFLPRERLQRSLDREGEVNVVLMAGSPDLLRRALTASDLGLRLLPGEDELTVESVRFVLRDEAAEALSALAEELGARHGSYLTYLANEVRVGEASIPYSSVTAFSGPPEDLVLTDGTPAPPLSAGEILLNAWAAEQLGSPRVGPAGSETPEGGTPESGADDPEAVEPDAEETDADGLGAEVELDYFLVGDEEQLREETARFRLKGVVTMEGVGADPRLTPEFPGIHDADDISDWDPPFPVELSRVRPADEDYWDRHRAAPKAFVSAEDGRRLWRSRFGEVTALRLWPGEGESVEDLAANLEAAVPGAVPLEPLGLRLLAVREEGEAAARGATDFSLLFLAFSWFLITAAVLLVALLFSLAVERRAKEVGLLRALGFTAAKVRRRFLAEGATVAFLGSAVGLLAGVGYAWALMAGLRSWWLPAVGSQRLELFLTGRSLLLGFSLALLVTLVAIAFSLRRLRRVSAPALLAGSLEAPALDEQSFDPSFLGLRRSRTLPIAIVSLLLGGASLGLALAVGGGSPELFFGAGAALLISGLAAFAYACRRARGAGLSVGGGALASMALRNTARNPGRSILSVTLVACATFVIVAAGANRRTSGPAGAERSGAQDPGTGGYSLMAHSEVPLFEDLKDADGQLDLGIRPDTAEMLAGARVVGMKELPGDDASCLNLYRVETPRLLGVPSELLEAGGFEFHDAAEDLDNPWELLQRPLSPKITGQVVIPAVADYETATWILKKGLGDELIYRGEGGGEVRLRLVGLLQASIFQSDVLVSQEDLVRHFPSVAGTSTYLISPDPSTDPEALTAALEGDLADFGFDVTSTAGKLASYRAVQNTYISTFQTLGGLGLLLGTLGLAVVLLRNVLERRGELAVLRAFGFRHRRLHRLILLENVFLLALGLVIGTASAGIASLPYLLAGGSRLPWGSLLGTLIAVFAAGTLACALAARRALKAHLIPALRGL